jgi:hypothetical protein
VVWNIDWAWFDASGGRLRWLSVIDPGTGMAAEQLVPPFTESGAPRPDATERNTAITLPTVSWSMRQAGCSRAGGGHDGVVLPPPQHVNTGPKLARVRSGFVPETRAKSAEFAGIPFWSLRRR